VLNTKVVRNVTIAALAEIQHFCIRDERTTEFSVSVGRLPGQLGDSPQIAFLGHAKLKFAARVKDNFEAYEILHLLTILKNILLNMLLDTRYSATMLLPLSCECTNELLSCMFTLVIAF
jgi:hypothetical protein